MGRVRVSKWTQYRSEGEKKQKKNRNEENLLGFKNVKITKKNEGASRKTGLQKIVMVVHDQFTTEQIQWSHLIERKFRAKTSKHWAWNGRESKKNMRPWSHSVYQPREINVENRKPQIFCYSKTHHQANCLFELLKRSGGAGQWRQIMGSNKPPFNEAKL